MSLLVAGGFMLKNSENLDASSAILNLSGKERAEREKDIAEHGQQILYSRRYYDEEFEYR